MAPGDQGGLSGLGNPQTDVSEVTSTTIGDLEALLIRAIGPKRNRQIMAFDHADQWTQIAYEDFDKFLARVAPSTRRTKATAPADMAT